MSIHTKNLLTHHALSLSLRQIKPYLREILHQIISILSDEWFRRIALLSLCPISCNQRGEMVQFCVHPTHFYMKTSVNQPEIDNLLK